MNNYSKEKVLEWVNSSEAKAAKYEQEAKVKVKDNIRFDCPVILTILRI